MAGAQPVLDKLGTLTADLEKRHAEVDCTLTAEKQTVHIRGFPVLAMAGNSHLLIFKDLHQHKRVSLRFLDLILVKRLKTLDYAFQLK